MPGEAKKLLELMEEQDRLPDPVRQADDAAFTVFLALAASASLGFVIGFLVGQL